ncbi:rRNA methyltransferase 1, mitochondrial [Impatiens glandulifera]|uniref:rRNA methyltransferase 1, mitochondrial n=1 Tax=Impatiens glandulifera TaxID=253017 RepID=UPI001FB08E74|nr:rRNA methyltransferase 1, mitochondrial [Impatiens glandulifera]
MYSSLTKSQAFPLAIRVSSQPPRCFKTCLITKPQLLADGTPSGRKRSVSLDSLKFGKLPFVSYANYKMSVGNGVCFIRAQQNNSLTGGRTFSSSHAQEIVNDSSDNVVDKGETLPWLEKNAFREAKKLNRSSSGLKKIRSSWEESADKFLKTGSSTEEQHRKVSQTWSNNHREKDEVVKVEEVEMEKEEEGDVDPRWDKIKDRFNNRIGGDMNRRSGSYEQQRWNNRETWGRKTWNEAATESSIPKMVGEGVYGVGPVLAALLAERREFYRLYVQEGIDLSSNNRKKKDKKGFERVLKIAERMGLSERQVSKHDLNMIVDNRPHQGLVLDASPLEMVNIKQLDPFSDNEDDEEGKAPLWVALDEVTDPQNLGAIVRSSYFFGASGVVMCAKNSAPLSGVVSKASAGSLEFMELRSCKNMMQFLTSSAENGWRVIGGSVSQKATSLNAIQPGAPTILVLGSEGTGLRPLVERSCTHLVRIHGNIMATATEDGHNRETTDSGQEFHSFMAVESLNVSVAAGVLLHHLIGRTNSTT